MICGNSNIVLLGSIFSKSYYHLHLLTPPNKNHSTPAILSTPFSKEWVLNKIKEDTVTSPFKHHIRIIKSWLPMTSIFVIIGRTYQLSPTTYHYQFQCNYQKNKTKAFCCNVFAFLASTLNFEHFGKEFFSQFKYFWNYWLQNCGYLNV